MQLFVYFWKCCALVVILLNLSFLKKKIESEIRPENLTY